MASASGTDVQGKRDEIRALYENIIREWSALDPTQASSLTQRRTETMARFDKFIPVTQPGNAAPWGAAYERFEKLNSEFKPRPLPRPGLFYIHIQMLAELF